MLNTLHDGPFSQMKEQGDIHVHHYQKGENPDDKKKKEKEAKANGNGNGVANGTPKEEEQQAPAPPPPEDPGNPMAKFSKDEVERIRSILKKEKEEKESETKLEKKAEKVNTKPKMKDTKISEKYDVKTAKTKFGKITVKSFDSHDDAKSHLASMNKKGHKGIISQGGKPVKEMSGDLAYRAMDKADRKSRGEMSVSDPKKAKKKAQQAQKFADYSIKKTLSKEELEHAHNQALEENAKRDLMAFGAKLKGYSDRSGGIDKSYFENIAKKAMAGIMPGAKDIEGDTDPRDFVLDMMNRTFPKQIMKQYKGLSPSFDNYLNMNYDIHNEANDMKIPPYANRKTAQAEKKEREKRQRERAGLDEARKSDYQLYHKDFSSAMQHAYAVAKKRGYTVDKDDIDNKVATGPRKPSSGKTNRYILGTDKKQNLHVQVANLDNKRYELNMYIEEVIPEETKMIPTNEKKLDPVGQEDGDVDNDGDKDSSDNYLMKRRNAIKKAMGKRKTGMKEEHQLNTMTDGAFTTADMLAQTYLSMPREEQIQTYTVNNSDLEEHHEKDANGEPIPHDDEEGNEINEVESAYAKQIADYKAKGGTIKKHKMDKSNIKRAVSSFKAKLAKTQKIHSDQDEKERAEKEQQDEGHSLPMDKATVAKRVDMFKKLRDKKASQGYQKTGLANEEAEVNEISDIKIMDTIHKARKIDKQANTKGIGMGPKDRTYGLKKSRQANRMHDKLMKRRDFRELERHGRFLDKGEPGYRKAGIDKGHKDRAMHMKNMKKYNEELSKNVSKLNKIQENRRLERNKVVADGQGGAGEVGTDELTKNYQQNTPGQPNELIRESSVVVNSQDMFKRFEDMVSYMMGISVTHPESFQMFPIGESGRMRLEYEHGPLATICETDVINFFGPNVDMEQFVEMVKEFGVNVTTAENSFVVGDSEGTEGTVKELSPGQYAEEYSKKYTTGGMMDQMRANIEAIAKRI